MTDDMAGECSTSSGTTSIEEAAKRAYELCRLGAAASSFAIIDGGMYRVRVVDVAKLGNRERAFDLIHDLLAACELADQILARDGLQEIRGLAWHDGERWQIQEAIRRAKGEK